MPKSFYITTPIYYVNASPHIGHAYTTIVADTLARYHRMAGEETFFVTGTDEHGDKIAEAAQKAGITPKNTRIKSAPSSAISGRNFLSQRLFHQDHRFDHIETVRSILQKVYDAGDIYFGTYEGYYCIGCERFYMEKELVDGLCPDHQTKPEHRKESNYFFRMSKYQDWLINHIKTIPTLSVRKDIKMKFWLFYAIRWRMFASPSQNAPGMGHYTTLFDEKICN